MAHLNVLLLQDKLLVRSIRQTDHPTVLIRYDTHRYVNSVKTQHDVSLPTDMTHYMFQPREWLSAGETIQNVHKGRYC